MGNMKFGIFQNADWGLGGLVRFVGWWDSWIRGIRGFVGWWDGREQKVGFAEKKHAYSKQWRFVCIKGGISLPVDSRHNRPSTRLIALTSLSPSCASAAPSLAWRNLGLFPYGKC